MHPLFRLIATRPHLLVNHIELYGELVTQEARRVAREARRRAVLFAVAVFGLLFGLGFAGVALMMWAVTPRLDPPAIWVLILVPAVPLVAAIICVLAARARPMPSVSDTLTDQLKADASLLREMGAAS